MRTELTGVDLIAAERRRQIDEEGRTVAHDALHSGEDLAAAAACYATPLSMRAFMDTTPAMWPWGEADWKPTSNDRVRELVKAGALIAAEIDRLQLRRLDSCACPRDERGAKTPSYTCGIEMHRRLAHALDQVKPA